MQQLAADLAGEGANRNVDRPIVDNTDLTGLFNLTLTFAPQQLSSPAANSDLPSLFTALQEQLGLKLEAQTGPVEVLVIDHVERPSEN